VTVNWLENQTTYFWQVRAWNSTGTREANSGSWWDLTTQGSPPGAFNKNNPTDSAFWQPTNPTLTWLASPFATSYQYCIDTLDNNTCDTAWINIGNNTSIGLVGLTDGVTYYWQARASNGLGMIEADGGVWWRFMVDSLPPASFLKVKPLNVAYDQKTGPTLEWTRSVNAASYEYCIDKTANMACDNVWISVGTNISTTLNGLNYNTIYHWQVRARNPNGLTDANNGNWWSFETINTTVLKKLSPTNNVVVPNGFYLEWTPLNGAQYYEYCIDSMKNTHCDKKWVRAGNKTQVWIEGLRPGTNFYWQVRAKTALKKIKADKGIWWRFHTWP